MLDGGSREKSFSDKVSREPSRKITQNCKNDQIQAFFGFTKPFLPFWAIFREGSLETLSEKIFERLPPSNMSSKHVQNDHIYQKHRLEDNSDNSRALPILLKDNVHFDRKINILWTMSNLVKKRSKCVKKREN